MIAAYVSPVVDGTLPFRAVQAVLYVVDDAGDTAFVIASVSTTASCWLGKLVDCVAIGVAPGVAPSLRLQEIEPEDPPEVPAPELVLEAVTIRSQFPAPRVMDPRSPALAPKFPVQFGVGLAT